jgi:apolipoprotein N-acyltransferase
MRAFVSRRRLLLSTALLWWLAGAFQIFPLGWIALAPFFYSLEDLPKKQRFRVGYATGFVSFWLINWWLVPTITKGAPAIGASILLGFPLSVISVTFIAAIHAFQPALVALLWGGDARLRPLLVALAWAMGDYARTLTSLAHEWGALAFSQTSDLPFLQVAAVLGQHGITFFCAFFAACVALWWKSRDKKWIVAPTLILLGLHIWGLVRLQIPDEGQPLRVLVVQTAVSSLNKSGLVTGESPFIQAFRLTEEALKKENRQGGKPFDLIVWPETTTSLRRFGSHYSGLDWETWRREGPKLPLLMGAQAYDERNRSWNEAVLIAPDGTTQVRAKTRLVPFGERAPLVEFLPFLQIFAPSPMLEPGDGVKTFDLGGKTTLDTQICFESCFPQRVAGRLLVMLTNDEWFSGTEAPRQHRAMATMRAVENGIPLVQSANGGYSFVVTRRGRVVMASQFGLPQTLDASILVPR